jgi:hypothetical protein
MHGACWCVPRGTWYVVRGAWCVMCGALCVTRTRTRTRGGAEPNVRGYHALLKSYLDEDGLVPVEPVTDEQFRLAQ